MQTSTHLQLDLGIAISSVPASPVSHSAPQAKCKQKQIIDFFGPNCTELFAKLDPDSCCWRTCLDSSLLGEVQLMDEYSGSYPKRGTMRNGKLYRQPMLEPSTCEKGSGLLPTPTTRPDDRSVRYKQGGTPLGVAINALLPTPTASDIRNRKPGNPFLTSNGTIRHRNAKGGQSQMRLSQVVQLLPTPTARDWKSGSAAQVVRPRAEGLNDRIAFLC